MVGELQWPIARLDDGVPLVFTMTINLVKTSMKLATCTWPMEARVAESKKICILFQTFKLSQTKNSPTMIVHQVSMTMVIKHHNYHQKRNRHDTS